MLLHRSIHPLHLSQLHCIAIDKSRTPHHHNFVRQPPIDRRVSSACFAFMPLPLAASSSGLHVIGGQLADVDRGCL